MKAEVYDLDSRLVWSKQATVDIPEDGVVNDIFRIDFPADITSVHFIKLRLYNELGKEVANTFYWRSTDEYQGRKTLTGPASSGFEALSNLKPTKLKTSYSVSHNEGRHYVKIVITNPSSRLAFFTQLQLLDSDDKPIRPSFYTDNFFSLLPGERKTVIIETAEKDILSNPVLVVKGWNVKPVKYSL